MRFFIGKVNGIEIKSQIKTNGNNKKQYDFMLFVGKICAAANEKSRKTLYLQGFSGFSTDLSFCCGGNRKKVLAFRAVFRYNVKALCENSDITNPHTGRWRLPVLRGAE